MTRRFLEVSVLLAVFAVPCLHAQTQRYQTPLVWCGQDLFHDPETTADKRVFDWDEHFVKLSRVGTIFMPSFSNGDSMSRPYWADADLSNGYPWGAPGWDETWYMPADSGTGRATLYRLYSGQQQDHMDSESPTEGAFFGYSNEGPVGNPWTNWAPGRQAIARYFNSTYFDHRTERPNLSLSDVNGSGQTITYGMEFQWDGSSRPALYGYPRFGTRYNTMNWPADGRCAVLNNPQTYQYTLDNGTVRVEFNRDWGNAIQKIFFDGRQLVDGYDIGMMVQTCLWIDAGHGGDNPNFILNPTESGGDDPYNPGFTFRWAGSPIVSVTPPAAFNPSNPAPITLTTVLKPLNFASDSFYQTDWNETSPTQPLLWRGTFTRPTTLGYQSNTGYLNNVIKMGFGAQLDSDVTDTTRYGNTHMNPTFWLYLHNFGTNGTATTAATDAQTAIRYAWFNAATNSDSAVTSGIGEQTRFGADTTNHALIAYANGGGFAVGIFSKNVINNQIYRYESSVGCVAECDANEEILIMNVNDFKDIRSGQTNSDSYMVIGTLAQVKSSIRKIYCTETGSCTI